jgi:hypothetical protein
MSFRHKGRAATYNFDGGGVSRLQNEARTNDQWRMLLAAGEAAGCY